MQPSVGRPWDADGVWQPSCMGHGKSAHGPPRHNAAATGDVSLLATRLLALGRADHPDISARDYDGSTALHVACGSGHLAAATLLIGAAAWPK